MKEQKEQQEEKNLEVSGIIAKTEQYIQNNKKKLTIICGVVVVVALAIWAYIALVAQPRQVRAAEDMYAAEQWFNQGEFEQALNGNDQYLGFSDIISEYRSTKSGNLARYYAGICQLNLGQYNEAIDLLKSYKGKDAFTGAEALMLIGDAYAELENNSEAAKYYEKAAAKAANFIIAPAALWKAGMMHIALGDNDAAVKAFQQIKDNYPESPEYGEADKYIAYAQNK
ncbi:MAG: tetratricopeptide repeat protein [Bacteroidales bacterium]|nr:tetratricopeptide repeat protein [Bacteroidales bacterium]